MSLKRRLHAIALPLTFVLAAPCAHAQTAINTPIFDLPVSNFRDIAGVAQQFGGSGYAYNTTNDGTMRTGVFYRANALGGMTTQDQAIINKLGIVLDIDLRTPSEIATNPDIVPAGATYQNINVIGGQAVNFSISTPAATIAFMQQTNQNFVSVDHERAAIANVLLDLAHADGAVLFHCTAGKDRTGWVTAVLDNIAGVSASDTMANYLATNAYSAAAIARQYQGLVLKYGTSFANAYAPALGVQSSFLQAGLDQVALQYGTMQNYITQGLGLTQEDIYVLRAKMVYYNQLPGEAAMAGNAASGAAFLRSLQNSPLSGNYTDFNYYLQSAITAGSLGGVESRVGGQIYADTASALSRSALQTNQSIALNSSGVNLAAGTGTVWTSGLGEYGKNRADHGNSADVEHAAGGLMGATYRVNTNVSVYAGFGYGVGSISSAGAGNNLNTYSAVAGGRYALTSLQQGLYASVQTGYEYADMRTRRGLGYDLGTATSHTHANVVSGQVALGDRLIVNHSVISPEIGVYTAHVDMNAFNETGSELALDEAALKHTLTAMTLSVPVQLPTIQAHNWMISPTLTASYMRVLGSPLTRSVGTAYGYSISQHAAFRSPNLINVGAGVSASKGAWSVQGTANSQFTTNGGTGFSGNLSLNYKF